MSWGKSVEDAFNERTAAGEELEIVWGDDWHLTIDLDTPEAITGFNERLEVIQKFKAMWIMDSWLSRKKGQHVYLGLADRTGFQERAALQAFLGSDPMRELLGYFNVNRQVNEDPFTLFKPAKESK